MKADININTVPITFQDNIYSDKLKVSKDHSTNKKMVFVNTDSGELYSAEYVGGEGEGTVERNAPYNQTMNALSTTTDGDLACSLPIFIDPQGKVDVYINGLNVPSGLGKDCYFSVDNGITARVDGEELAGDKLYWNGSIAGYQLEITDKIDFDYIISTSGTPKPAVNITISGGIWGSLPEAIHRIEANIYEEPPLESWKFYQNSDNYLELMTSESSTDLVEMCRIAVGGVISTHTILYPIGSITHDQKKIVDQLFITYIVNGITLSLERSSNWTSFSIE